jgi:hypothetical protein
VDTAEFLAHVLPDSGPYIVAVPRRTNSGLAYYKHFLAETTAEAATVALARDRAGDNVYFAVGSLKAGRIRDEGTGRYKISREGTNIRGLRSYILDMDAGPGRQYPSVEDALASLIQFTRDCKLPKPTIVSSGNGLHIYWTLEQEVAEIYWEQHGTELKALADTHGLKIDPGRTADSSSVLRVVGTHNHKYEGEPEVHVLYTGTPSSAQYFHSLLALRSPTSSILATHGPPLVSLGPSNTNRFINEPLSFRLMVERCQVLRYIAEPANQTKEATPEPAWLGAITLVRHCKNGRKAAHLISQHDLRYKAGDLDAKLDRLERMDIGPTTCAKFQEAFKDHVNADCCNGCPSKGLITSPAVIAKYIEPAPPLIIPPHLLKTNGTEILVSEPPSPYIRTSRGIGMEIANSKTGQNETIIVSDYDMHPIRLRYDERTKLEDDVRWRVHMPHEGWIELDIPHTSKQLMGLALAKRGVYINDHHIPHVTNFMTAYLRRLQNDIPREMAFSKFGYRKSGEFVLGETLYKPDGTVENHCISHALDSATQQGVVTQGDIDKWREQIMLYARPKQEAYRCYLYSTFGSPFYHLTGQIATCVSATGATGLGKSTLMDVCASVWGDPSRLIVRGSPDGSTRAAAEVLANSLHHLPVCMDEITGRDAKDVAALIFNYSGGKGKIRSTAHGGIRADTATWSNLLLLNANTDEYERMSGVFRDSSQHMVRLVQLDFVATGAISKAEGDTLRRIVHEHYGWAGHLFASYCAQHYAAIKQRILAVNIEIDKKVNAQSEERFWTAWIACCQVGAEIAQQLGLLPNFPISADVAWMCSQISHLRANTSIHLATGGEIIAEFLDAKIGNTLTIGAKGAGNIDNILNEPRGELIVRYELDNDTCYVNRAEFRTYCTDKGVNFNRTMLEMQKAKILTRDNILKVLGSGTQFGKGKVRSIEISIDALGGKGAKLAIAAPVVVPIRTGVAKP